MREIFDSQNWNRAVGTVIGILIVLILGILGVFLVIRLHSLIVTRSRKYPLFRGGADRVEVRWTYGIKQMTVFLDNLELGQIVGRKNAKEGRMFRLPDGTNLFVKIGLADDLIVNPEPLPIVELHGKPLPGSTNDPKVQLERTSRVYLLAGLGSMLQGFLISYWISGGYPVWVFWVGVTSVITSIYLRRQSRIALWIAYIIAIVSVIDFFQGIELEKGFLASTWDFIEAVWFAWGLRSTGSALSALEKERAGEVSDPSIIEASLPSPEDIKAKSPKPSVSKKPLQNTQTKKSKKTTPPKKKSAVVKGSTVKKTTKAPQRKKTVTVK